MSDEKVVHLPSPDRQKWYLQRPKADGLIGYQPPFWDNHVHAGCDVLQVKTHLAFKRS